ncbi:MAG: Fpg/Nei family DNA glycosylase [Nocardioides sp.]|uniref:Fpg/Nei family DNA glycosylase n=1 Tax=Nocardioides sp. TaxID=35761 RepID=UPI0023A1D734|nr:DNA-formamidopyrimidine glycosylase family protein [Nocardioides sp.]MDE0775759.1 Fpg/Nei family DNA glycosylase [Nocardioides sp.]
MPEGHTLHRLARHLTEAFAAKPVSVTSPQGRFAESAARLDGDVLVGAEAWGKQLFVEFVGERFIHVHLGLIGRFDLHPYVDQVPPPVGQVRLRLVGETAYADLRGASACDLWTASQREAVAAAAGPDPLREDADPERAWDRVRRSRLPIGALLMDQSVLAGVGNVYRAELLFRAGMHPLRPGSTLRSRQWQALWDDLVPLMAEGVRTGRIDTVRAEHTPQAMGRAPRVDDHGGEVYVYRRHGLPCLVCGRRVSIETLRARNSYWCSRCQPVFRSRAVR